MKRALLSLIILLSSIAFAQNEKSPTLQLFFTAQQTQIEQEDLAMAKEQQEVALKFSAEKNKLIEDTSYSLCKAADSIAQKTNETAQKAHEQVKKIERLKFEILRASVNTEVSKQELEVLKKTLSDEYNTLESEVYIATSLGPYIKLRGSTFDAQTSSWNMQIYSEFFYYTTLLNQTFSLSYYDLLEKKIKTEDNSLQTIDLYDSLFRKATPVVYIKVFFKIYKWKGASEYGFVPTKIELRRVAGDSLIKNFDADDLFNVPFFMYPQLDVRSELERQVDVERSAVIFNQEPTETLLKKNNAVDANKKFKLVSEQKGRRTFYFITDYMLTPEQIENFDLKEVTFNSIKGVLAFGIGKFGFLGGSLGLDYKNSLKDTEYSAGISGGVNLTLGSYLRPYVELGFEYHTDYKGVITPGVGLDVMFGKLLLNANYHYNIPFLFEELNTKMLDHYHTFAAGIGVTW